MAARVLMLGLDALVPTLVEKFEQEGILPKLGRLMRGGCFSRLLSAIPAQTPANWHTVATGATPGAHSVTVWGAHRPDDPVPEIHSEEAFNSGLCLAEYIWETAARFGKRSVVMNYAGYPATTDHAVHIDGLYQPTRSYYDICPPTVYHTLESPAGDRIAFQEAAGWSGLPQSTATPLSAEVHVAPASPGDGPTYHALLLAQGDGYDSLLLCEGKDAGDPIVRLSAGEWSDWVKAPFHTQEMGEVEGAFRFRLVECSADGKRFRLWRSEVFPTDGRFVSDPQLGRALVEELGPYVHAMMTAQLHVVHGLLDWETVDQALADEAAWWAAAAKMAMDRTGAELTYLHYHLPDLVGHTLVPGVDPEGTAYAPDKAEESWALLRDYYRAIDRFVGEFLQRFDLSEDVIAVVAEHGMPANKKAVSLVNAFRGREWLALSPDGRDVNWSESRLFFSQNHLWVNLRGREPSGIVPPEQYRKLRGEVQQAMRDIKDPETGEHVFSFVLTREEAPMVGLYGEHVGDLVFCYAGGYRWSGPEVLKLEEERVVFPCGGGNHGPMICTYETEVASVYGLLILAGNGVRQGIREAASEKGARRTVDVAPTLARLLAIEAPAQNEGRALQEFLVDLSSERPERRFTRTARHLVSKPRPRRTVRLQGDVTDEEAP